MMIKHAIAAGIYRVIFSNHFYGQKKPDIQARDPRIEAAGFAAHHEESDTPTPNFHLLQTKDQFTKEE